MKHRLLAVVTFIALLLCGCSATADTPAADAPATDAPATDAPATDAPATDTPATDTPAADAPATDEPAEKEVWEIKYYTDEFNRPTSEWYVAAVGEGTFSNSATSNSYLLGAAFADFKGDVFLKLMTYGRNTVSNPYSTAEDYTISILSPNGTKLTDKVGVMNPGEDQIYFWQPKDVLKILKGETGEGTVTFLITKPDRPIEKYLLSIETGNFNTLYKK